MTWILKLGIRGALVGAALAAMAPQEAVIAEGCICSDFGSGSYSCSADHMSCEAGGSETCVIICE